jgi:hypothetical protein
MGYEAGRSDIWGRQRGVNIYATYFCSLFSRGQRLVSKRQLYVFDYAFLQAEDGTS